MTVSTVVFDAYGTLYDVQSVAAITNETFPGNGELITQLWRIKQLEYTWLRSVMRRYENFETVTRQSLVYTLKALGLSYDDALLARVIQQYDRLSLYPDVVPTLQALPDRKRAILSNGSPAMLTNLMHHSGLNDLIDVAISVDLRKTFKPAPEVYALIESELGALPAETLFVTSNPWDVAGAKAFGLKTAWIERVTPDVMAASCADKAQPSPLVMFQAIRMQMDELDLHPDYRIRGLSELPGLLRP